MGSNLPRPRRFPGHRVYHGKGEGYGKPRSEKEFWPRENSCEAAGKSVRTGSMGAGPCPRTGWTAEWKDGDGRDFDSPPDDGVIAEVRMVEARSVEAVPALTMNAREMEARFDARVLTVVMKDFEDVRWRYRALMYGLRMQRARVRTIYKRKDCK